MIRILGPALVLKQFSTDQYSGRVYVVGRQPGFMGWFLSAIGVDANTELTVTPGEVTFRKASLFGETVTVCPVTRVACVSAGYAKPVEYLLLAGMLVWTVIVPIVMLILFFLEKRMFVMVETTGGGAFAMAFKRSIIEGVEVNEEKAKEVVQILHRNIMASAAADGRGAGPAAGMQGAPMQGAGMQMQGAPMQAQGAPMQGGYPMHPR
ncbi:MAG: hypothetical protein IPM54_10700 [Polyangiaceae bacterium]|nr:hypothetical protein [Polyangiaceae bacterium]